MKGIGAEFAELLKRELAKLEGEIEEVWLPDLEAFSGAALEELKRLCGLRTEPGRPTLDDRLRGAEAKLKARPAMRPPAPALFPGSHSWLDVKGQSYAGPVKNQGFCSACAAFGSVAAMEILARIADSAPAGAEGAGPPPLSEAQVFFLSPGFSQKPGSEGHNCLRGWTVEGALDFCRDTGVVPEALYPYPREARPAALPADWQARTTAIASYRSLTEPEEMKAWIAGRGPLVTAMIVHLDFFLYRKGIYRHVLGPAIGGHCVCVVGYDEARSAWLCRNSWGERWGEGGYFRIGYGQCGVDAEMWAVEGLSRTTTR